MTKRLEVSENKWDARVHGRFEMKRFALALKSELGGLTPSALRVEEEECNDDCGELATHIIILYINAENE